MLLPAYWITLKDARLGDEFIIENTAISGTPRLITLKCVMINTSGVQSIHFFCKVPKIGDWNPTGLKCALDTETPFNTFELVISPTDSTQFTYGNIE